jgi:hypothetical protein
LKNVASKSNKDENKKLFLVAILKVTDEKQDPFPEPDPRIRTKTMTRIRNTAA